MGFQTVTRHKVADDQWDAMLCANLQAYSPKEMEEEEVANGYEERAQYL